MSVPIRVVDVQLGEESFRYRTPIKFGGVALDRATILNAHVVIEDKQGRQQIGFGSMPLGNVWAFPSKALTYDQTLQLMQEVAEEAAHLTLDHRGWGHPIELHHELLPVYHQAAQVRSASLVEVIPPLASLVAISPIDAAIHDAYGKLHGLSSYACYGPEFLSEDVGHFLGKEYRGIALADHIRTTPVERLPLYHLVGALDALTADDVVTNGKPDPYPQHLMEWIRRDRLTHLKIKLNGDDLAWDVNRVLRIESAAQIAQAERGCNVWHYSLDFNEKCQHVAYLEEFMQQVSARAPSAWSRVQYIEQPTSRHLKQNTHQRLQSVSQRIPVVMDEALLDIESMHLAMELGYTGVALKACKGQSSSLLLACAARHRGMFLCVQDLTCPGPSLIHSAGLAAHVMGVQAIEANARQYLPAANERWKAGYPGLFEPIDGQLQTGQLTGLGLSVR
ncbi:MAG: enolase C-terminal domain-like protein [Gemmatales bacterium]